jgi:hypothetical protein
MLNLTVLLINNHQLSGGLEPLQNLTEMVYIDAARNDLSGGLAPLQNLAGIQVFSASYNELSGDLSSVPKSLQTLWVEGNKISGLGFNSSEMSALSLLNLGGNKVVGDGVEIVKGLPSSLQFLNISHNDLRGDIGYFISNVSSETDVIDLYVTESGLTGTACPGLTGTECPIPLAAGLFRDLAWQTQEMGTLIMRKSGSGNITLESTKLKLSDVEYDTPKDRPQFDKSRYREDGWGSLVDMSGYCEKREKSTSKPGPRAGAFGSDLLVFRTAEPDDKYLVFCPVQADEELLNWHGQPRVTRAGKGIEVDSIYSKVYDVESFSYVPESGTVVAGDFKRKKIHFLRYARDEQVRGPRLRLLRPERVMALPGTARTATVQK